LNGRGEFQTRPEEAEPTTTIKGMNNYLAINRTRIMDGSAKLERRKDGTDGIMFQEKGSN
jgi:hypothetical protein